MPDTYGHVVLLSDSTNLQQVFIKIFRGSVDKFFKYNNLEDFINHCQCNEADILLVDLNIPVIFENGIFENIRNLKTTKFSHIVALSADNRAEKALEVYQYGADEWIAVPFRPTHVKARLESQLQKIHKIKRMQNDFDIQYKKLFQEKEEQDAKYKKLKNEVLAKQQAQIQRDSDSKAQHQTNTIENVETLLNEKDEYIGRLSLMLQDGLKKIRETYKNSSANIEKALEWSSEPRVLHVSEEKEKRLQAICSQLEDINSGVDKIAKSIDDYIVSSGSDYVVTNNIINEGINKLTEYIKKISDELYKYKKQYFTQINDNKAMEILDVVEREQRENFSGMKTVLEEQLNEIGQSILERNNSIKGELGETTLKLKTSEKEFQNNTLEFQKSEKNWQDELHKFYLQEIKKVHGAFQEKDIEVEEKNYEIQKLNKQITSQNNLITYLRAKSKFTSKL